MGDVSVTTPEIKALRDASRGARRRADDYRRQHEREATRTPQTAERASELDRLAVEASARLAMAESQWRVEARAQRRAEADAEGASLQARLRAETRARHEARPDPPPAARG